MIILDANSFQIHGIKGSGSTFKNGVIWIRPDPNYTKPLSEIVRMGILEDELSSEGIVKIRTR